MNLQLDQFLFILRIVLVALIYLFLIQLIFVVRRDLVRMASGGGAVRAGTTATKGLGVLIVVKPGPMPLRPGHRIEMEPVTTIGRVASWTFRPMAVTARVPTARRCSPS